MEINYSNNSFKSRLIKNLIILSGFKNNTSSISNTKKYILKCQKSKIGKYTFKDMKKINYKDYTMYAWNGTIEDSKDSFLIYIHGGSFIANPLNLQIRFVKKIAKKLNSTLIVPLYKTIPNGSSDELLKEMKSIYEFLLKKQKKIYLIGDSAGGGATLSFDLLLAEENLVRPNAVIMLSPWLDLSLNNEKIKEKKDIVCSVSGNKYCGELWSGNYDIKHYKVSPIYGNFESLNKIFVSCSNNEICQPDCIKFVDKLRQLGIDHRFVQFDNQFHNFEIYPTVESEMLIEEIYKYVMEEK